MVIIGLCLLSVGAVGLAACLRRLPLPAGLVVALGGLTYSLYLLHQHIGYIIFNRVKGFASSAIVIATTIAAMVGLSWLVWRFVERPAQRLTKIFLTRWSDRLGLPDKLEQSGGAAPLQGEARQATGSLATAERSAARLAH